jgi:2-keto-3-deoxy-L-rhamnonate aldolase RhmA
MKTAGYDFLFIDMEHNSIKIPGYPRLSARHVASMLQASLH